MQILNTPSMLISPDSKRVEGLNGIGVAKLPGMYLVPAGENYKLTSPRSSALNPDVREISQAITSYGMASRRRVLRLVPLP
jgi:hypothetical protein